MAVLSGSTLYRRWYNKQLGLTPHPTVTGTIIQAGLLGEGVVVRVIMMPTLGIHRPALRWTGCKGCCRPACSVGGTWVALVSGRVVDIFIPGNGSAILMSTFHFDAFHSINFYL